MFSITARNTDNAKNRPQRALTEYL